MDVLPAAARAPPIRKRCGRRWRSAICRLISSDHAPYRFDETGKLRAGTKPNFQADRRTACRGSRCGCRCCSTRWCRTGRFDAGKVRRTDRRPTPAKIYNLHPRKGTIAIGADADIAIWDPAREVTLTDAMMHDRAGYTPYAGRNPARLAGHGVVARSGHRRRRQALRRAGSGRFLARSGGEPARPTGRLVADMDPEQNFGATLL